MKANQAARAQDEAVSPVLGTIMGVAIVVALAASVYFLIRLLTQGHDATPQVAFTQEGNVLSVTRAPSPPLDWTGFRATGTCAAHLQLKPTGGVAGPYPTAAGTPVKSGDQLSGCLTGETLVLSHVATNRVVYEHAF